MQGKQQVIEHIRQAFYDTERPDDVFLQGSHEGCEPGESISPFIGVTDWSQLDPIRSDDLARSCALPPFRVHERGSTSHRGLSGMQTGCRSHGLNTEAIKAALDCFWRDRAANGPTHQVIRQYRNEEAEYLRDIARGKE